MITSKSELNKYITEDRKVNGYKKGIFLSIKAYTYKSEGYVIYKYLYELRHCEYLKNKKGLINKIAYKIHAIKKSRLGTNYKIQIPEGVAGYGLRICHLSGGGGYFVEC